MTGRSFRRGAPTIRGFVWRRRLGSGFLSTQHREGRQGRRGGNTARPASIIDEEFGDGFGRVGGFQEASHAPVCDA